MAYVQGDTDRPTYQLRLGNKRYRTSIIITLPPTVSALTSALQVLENENIKLEHVESRSTGNELRRQYLLLCDSNTGNITSAIEGLKKLDNDLEVIEKSEGEVVSVPWFPTIINELDKYADRVLSGGAELQANHPGFTDPVYRQRRQLFADVAIRFKHGQQIPNVEYTEEEKKTWEIIFNKLIKLHPTHACREFNEMFQLLVKNCGYSENSIPQLQAVSDFLKNRTGFTLRPVAGLLSSRDFLAGLAFRVFHSTQYIRHSSKPLYTPEPDVCHELLGHAPLFADPSFADFSQEIGLASLGASDDFIEKLATLYWFTIEFGLCKEGEQIRAYGAGILSSFGELEYSLSTEPQRLPFDPVKASTQKYPITDYQPIYFVADSFDDAKTKVRKFAATSNRPFAVRCNKATQTIETLDSNGRLITLTSNLNGRQGEAAGLN